jgi:predicted nucleic acid-binding protein
MYLLDSNICFNDAYQYFTAKSHGLTLVSFDKDLKGKRIGAKTPAAILAALKE